MAYAQPQGMMPTAGGGRAKRPTWHWMLIGGVALFLALIVLALAVLIGWRILGRGDPADTVDDFYSSLQDADCDLFMESTTEEFRSATGLTSCAIFDENIVGTDAITYEVNDRINRQGYAIFEVTETYTVDGQSESADLRYYVRRIDGQWDLDGIELLTEDSVPIT